MSEEHFDVIIVGCGAAGIAAGLDLQSSSISSFTILEARDRIGGRAYTKKLDNVPIDLGASWIHNFDPNNALYKHMQCESLVDSVFPNDTVYYDYDGSQISVIVLEQSEEICEKLFDLVDEHRDKVLKEKEKDLSIAEVIEHAYNRELEGKSSQIKRTVDLILSEVEQYEASSLNQLSAACYQNNNAEDMSEKYVQNGYGTVLEKLGANLPVRLNTNVTYIDASNSQLIKICTNNSPNIVYHCKYLLITIPLGCLKNNTIEFCPPLPEWKLASIKQMGYGLMNKIILQFSSNFWGNEGKYINRTSNLIRGEFCFIFNLSKQYELPNENCNILALYVHGEFAYMLEKLTDDEIIEYAMQVLRRMYGTEIPKPLKYLITRW
ncbi:unnamed protein product, partial [Didymodactylos carnosus]